MRYDQISSELFIHNRKRFTAQLKSNSMAIFNSNDIMPTNGDGTMGFKQNSDIFHLSGVDQEESILVLFPDCRTEKHREILFVKETSELIAIWEGAKLTKEQATDISGIKTVYWTSQFETILKGLMNEAENIYLNSNEHTRSGNEVETRDERFTKWMLEKYPLHHYNRSTAIMHDIRAIKHEVEIQLIQQACNITEKAFRRILKYIKPGVWEYEIEAEIIHEFIRNKSRGFAYTPIIGSGHSACVLHYIENNKQCKDGDVILMDFGSEYANYASDMTRCVPVNGKFTERQKAVYNAVLKVMKEATNMLAPGLLFEDYNKEVGKIMTKELIGLGLLTETDVKTQDPNNPAYRKYFMHGTSHFLGIDVHDVGYFNKPIQENMCFTVEPGIYIPKENLGIRLENNIIVKSGGNNDLMKNIPLEADEIETLMNS